MLTQTLRRMERDGLLNTNLPIPHRPLPSLTERPTTIRNAGLSTARSQAAAIARQPHSARLPNMPPRHTTAGPRMFPFLGAAVLIEPAVPGP
jgi:hypothetical protein